MLFRTLTLLVVLSLFFGFNYLNYADGLPIQAVFKSGYSWIGLKGIGGSRYRYAFGGQENARKLPDLNEAGVVELQEGMEAGLFTAVDLVKAYFARINEVNRRGPELRAVIETNPLALTLAHELDLERARKGRRSLMHGIPVLVKDNIATDPKEGMNTTAGSYALLGSLPPSDATVVVKLRFAGAIILGKANLDEFSHARGHTPWGWSPRGGQLRSPFFEKGDPCGSSGGSAVAVAVGLAPVALGTETGWSITCPAGRMGIVGVKPGVETVSRKGVIPFSRNQDAVGPMTRYVEDAAIVLSIIAGEDPEDLKPVSTSSFQTVDSGPSHHNHGLGEVQLPARAPFAPIDYTRALALDLTTSLGDVRLGVPTYPFLSTAHSRELTLHLLRTFRSALRSVLTGALNATVLENAEMPSAYELVRIRPRSHVIDTDFKVGFEEWVKGLRWREEEEFGLYERDVAGGNGTKEKVRISGVEGLIAFNEEPKWKGLQMPEGYEDASLLFQSNATTGYDSTYLHVLSENRHLGATLGIDHVLQTYNLTALVLPSDGFTTVPSAFVGYPIVTVPLGFHPSNTELHRTTRQDLKQVEMYHPAPGVPFGVSFVGTKGSEWDLIRLAGAFERAWGVGNGLSRRMKREARPRVQLQDVMERETTA